MSVTNVLVTGAAGNVAQMLLPGLCNDYQLRLTDRTDIATYGAGAELLVGDLTERAFADQAVDGVDAIVHLAANPNARATWDELRGPNIDATVAVLDAAARHGVQKLIMASSIHAAGRYELADQVPVQSTWPPAPCCLYGASKAWNELTGQTYAHQTGLSVICLRLGPTMPKPTTPATLTNWLGPHDLRNLIRSCLEAPVSYAVYNGVSANTRNRWDISNATAHLGYAPTQDSKQFVHEVDQQCTGPRAAGTLCDPGQIDNEFRRVPAYSREECRNKQPHSLGGLNDEL